MKIQLTAHRPAPGVPGHGRVTVDQHAVMDATFSSANDPMTDDHNLTLDIPGLVAIEPDGPIELDNVVAGVLRRYVADVGMRDTVGTALVAALVERDARLGLVQAGLDSASFRELEHAAADKAKQLRSDCDQGNPAQRDAARDFSLAITALEDAGIRFTRGLAGLTGVRSDVDLERMDAADERARFTEQVTGREHEIDERASDGFDAGSGASA